MCNPRQVRVTATRQLCEAWEQEVSRTVELSGTVHGEARVRQALDQELGEPALRALEIAMAAEDSGWTETDDGFRFEVEGGYVVYSAENRELEIVARMEDDVSVQGEATQKLAGQLAENLEADAKGDYYDDNWGGRTEEKAKEEAAKEAQRILDEQAKRRVEQARQDAEAGAEADVEAEAKRQAEIEFQRVQQAREAELAASAREHLNEVGLRCRQAFHAVLANAYRDAILAYARNNGAEGLQCNEDGETIEIEFLVDR